MPKKPPVIHIRVSPPEHHNVTRCGIIDPDNSVVSINSPLSDITCKLCRVKCDKDNGQFKYDGRGEFVAVSKKHILERDL